MRIGGGVVVYSNAKKRGKREFPVMLIKILAVISSILLIGGVYFHTAGRVSRGDNAKIALTQEFNMLKPMPKATQVDYREMNKDSLALVQVIYQFEGDFSEVKNYYMREAEKNEWVYEKEVEPEEWGNKTGGKKLVFLKKDLKLAVEYKNNPEFEHGKAIFLSLSWGI